MADAQVGGAEEAMGQREVWTRVRGRLKAELGDASRGMMSTLIMLREASPISPCRRCASTVLA